MIFDVDHVTCNSCKIISNTWITFCPSFMKWALILLKNLWNEKLLKSWIHVNFTFHESWISPKCHAISFTPCYRLQTPQKNIFNLPPTSSEFRNWNQYCTSVERKWRKSVVNILNVSHNPTREYTSFSCDIECSNPNHWLRFAAEIRRLSSFFFSFQKDILNSSHIF